jgi:putative alpha-1,2-mannosidase
MMHESGTGGAPKYGVVSQMPVSGRLNITEVQLASPRGAPDNGSVGYYSSTLASGVKVELAGTDHAGFFQYSFPAAAEKHVVIDVGHFLPSFRGLGWSQYYLGGKIGVGSDGHYQGK